MTDTVRYGKYGDMYGYKQFRYSLEVVLRHIPLCADNDHMNSSNDKN